MHEAVCSVTNDALDNPLTATAVVYVTEPPVMLSLNVPNITKEGEPINIACVYMGGRPPARVFVRIGEQEILENVVYRNHSDAILLLTSATLTKFRKEWNNRRVSCCRSNPHYTNKTLCSESNPVQHLFPPDSITVRLVTCRIDAQDYNLVRSTCTIHNANPACKPQWIVPNNLIFDETFLSNKPSGDPDGGIDSLWEASFNVSTVHSGQLVVCRALCRDFNVTAQGSFAISIPVTTTTLKQDDTASWGTAPVVTVIGISAIIIACLSVIIVLLKKRVDAKSPENAETSEHNSQNLQSNQDASNDNRAGPSINQSVYQSLTAPQSQENQHILYEQLHLERLDAGDNLPDITSDGGDAKEISVNDDYINTKL